MFESFAGTIVHLGDVGAGQAAKLVNNCLMAAHVALARHALDAAAALGIDARAFTDLVKVSSGRSFGFEVFSRLPSPAAFATGAPLLLKDMNLLKAVLPGNVGAKEIDAAAARFLAAANP